MYEIESITAQVVSEIRTGECSGNSNSQPAVNPAIYRADERACEM